MESKRAVVDINKYKCVKILLESKAPYEEIEEMTGISKAVIGRIKKTQNFEEYKQMIRATAAAYSAKARERMKAEEEQRINEQVKLVREEQKKFEEQAEKPKPQATNNMVMSQYQINALISKMQATNDILKEMSEHMKLLSNKVTFIVDELTK